MSFLQHKTSLRYTSAILLLLTGVFILVGNVHASTGLSIQQLKVTHTLKPGESISGVVQIKNAGDNTVNVETKVEDFIPLAGTYNIQFVGRAPGVSTVRDWITLDSPASFVLGRGASKEVQYTIKAPSSVEPGGHFGVVFFKASELPENGQPQLKVGTQVGMLVLVTIPGSHLEKGGILDFKGPLFVQKSPIDFIIKFENTGTVHFEPKGSITVTNLFGNEVGSVPIGGQVVLPTGVKDLGASINFDGVLLGRYQAYLKMFDGEGNELAARSVIFYALPVWYLVGFIVAVTALFVIIKFLKRKVKISFQ